MRALDKVCNKATAYKTWIDELSAKGEVCKSYYPSHKYCKDIKANLLLIQNGVCAYTEIQLDDTSQFRDTDWHEGIFDGNSEFQGHLDHFDSSLKKKGKDSWIWENFFFVHPTINNCKNDVRVFDILKPDRPGYDPFQLLDYDLELDIFIVSEQVRNPEDRERIKYMIGALRLNHGFIKRMRLRHLNEVFSRIYARIDGIDKLGDLSTTCFFTAFEFTKRKLQTN